MSKLLKKVFKKDKAPKSSKSDVTQRPATEGPSSNLGYQGERSATGARHGWGRFMFQSGDVYEGEWQDNTKWGYGDAIYCSGSRYRGEWKADAKHGKGIFVFGHDGSSYTGDWVDDKKTGYGVAVFRTGNRYAGQWEHDAMHGRGRFVYASGDAYEGDWQWNRKTGFGTWTSADGNCTYAGAWREDLRHGAGVLRDTDGIVYGVEYENGDLKSKKRPKKALAPPDPVDRSPPEPPVISSHRRASAAPLRVPKAPRRATTSCVDGASTPPAGVPNDPAATLEAVAASASSPGAFGGASPQAASAMPAAATLTPALGAQKAPPQGVASATGGGFGSRLRRSSATEGGADLSTPPAVPFGDREGVLGDMDDDAVGWDDTPKDAGAVSGSGEATGESQAEAEVLERLRAWRKTAPAPPQPHSEAATLPPSFGHSNLELSPSGVMRARGEDVASGGAGDAAAAASQFTFPSADVIREVHEADEE